VNNKTQEVNKNRKGTSKSMEERRVIKYQMCQAFRTRQINHWSGTNPKQDKS